MSRAVCFGMLLFVCPFLSPSWAQNKTEPTDTGPRRPQTLPFQWDYSCPGAVGKDCSFLCTGEGGRTVHVIRLRINLEAITVEGSQKAPAVFYDFATMEIPQASGFVISAGLGTLACQVSGMRLDYSGPPK
jgi:hypothetical protein